ncbi:HAMP domain-containing histidine kinase [Vibrio sp. SS-MA-C1-2]|uniref:sensor histidine kinase n=1 Tax=Vibrio sp. SS-MA-C1-2 TaxID=2908646 RepID=UPI001F442A98|nr:HAMP domain-containing sensor histidine kinase [Vibrio sp. SS-MA-C1-2]UJF18048.1 HAMP domain-containing histidine kinase [Vibrio sp. SS-MA-C1-2]
MVGSLRLLGLSIIAYGLFSGFLYIDNVILGPITRLVCAFFILIYLIKTLTIFDNERVHKIESRLEAAFHNKKLQDIGELTACITHEIKTPLSSSLMRCDLLEQQLSQIHQNNVELNEQSFTRINKQLSHIRCGVLSAAQISQELLQFSHRGDVEYSQCHVISLVQDSIALLQHKLELFNINVSIPNHLCVYGNKNQLEEVLINIINNSIDAAKEEKRIDISATLTDLSVEIVILDYSGGIAIHHIDKVKQPFFSTKDKKSGTGLGIPLTIKILEYNNGFLQFVNSSKGLKSTIRLPIDSI